MIRPWADQPRFVTCTDCRTRIPYPQSYTAFAPHSRSARIVCVDCYRDSIVRDLFTPDCVEYATGGCCDSCEGTGAQDTPETGGRCWDCYGTRHAHGRYGTALRVTR